MKGSLKITDSFVFYEAASTDIKKRISAILPNISKQIEPKVAILINSAIFSSPTTQSLLAGKLKDDFGLFGNVASTALQNVINYISQNIEVKLETAKGSILTLSIIVPSGDISSILDLPGASYPSKSGEITWLEWLLTRGTEVIIGDFWVFPHAKGFTRSGGRSIMLRLVNQGEPFRVDPGYAGTAEDNFIIRAIEPIGEDILKLAYDAVVRSL